MLVAFLREIESHSSLHFSCYKSC